MVKAPALPGSTEIHVRREEWGCGRRLPAQAFSVLGLCGKPAEQAASEDAETARAVCMCHLYYLLNLNILLSIGFHFKIELSILLLRVFKL